MATQSLKEALLEIQKKAPKVQESGFNEYTDSRFMPLDKVLAVILPLLNEKDILWSTLPTTIPNAAGAATPGLEYSFYHLPTGIIEQRVVPLPLVKGTAQEMGSAITYMRRYCLVAALNLVAEKDDDGHSATAPASLPEHKPQVASNPEQDAALRQEIVDLGATLKKESLEDWKAVEQWAKEREIDLNAPPANKLRPIERALRRRLETARSTTKPSKK